jgi:hypothetical protein
MVGARTPPSSGTAANQINGLVAGRSTAMVALPTNLIAEREGSPSSK